jgi:hypothetical protein
MMEKIEQKLDNWFLQNADFETLEKMGFEMFSESEKETEKRVNEVNKWWKKLPLWKKSDFYLRFATRENDYERMKNKLKKVI